MTALGDALRRFERDGFAAFAADFARRDLLRGRRGALRRRPGSAREGIAGGVSASGELLLRTPRRHRADRQRRGQRPPRCAAEPAPPSARARHAEGPAAVLLAANLLFFGFTRGWFDGLLGLQSLGDREPERIANQVRPGEHRPDADGVGAAGHERQLPRIGAGRRSRGGRGRGGAKAALPRAAGPTSAASRSSARRRSSPMSTASATPTRRRRRSWPGCGSTARAAASVPARARAGRADRAGARDAARRAPSRGQRQHRAQQQQQPADVERAAAATAATAARAARPPAAATGGATAAAATTTAVLALET